MLSINYEKSLLAAIVQAWVGGSTQSSNTVTFPSSGYIGLYTTLPTRNSSTGEFENGVEVSGGGYARINLDTVGLAGAHYFTAAAAWDNSNTQAAITNTVAIQFPQSTASWGTIVGFGIFDAASGGNAYLVGSLNSSVTVSANQAVSFAAQALKISLTDATIS